MASQCSAFILTTYSVNTTPPLCSFVPGEGRLTDSIGVVGPAGRLLREGPRDWAWSLRRNWQVKEETGEGGESGFRETPQGFKGKKECRALEEVKENSGEMGR